MTLGPRARDRSRLLALTAVLSLAPVGGLRAQWIDFPVPEAPAQDSLLVARGRRVYERHCWYCHGREGRGDGPVADYLWPRPRSFYDATFRLRSTESGFLPRDEDLYRSVSLGIPATAMPSWSPVLTPEERWSVIGYIKEFAADLFGSPYMHPDSGRVSVGLEPDYRPDSLVSRGRRLYRESECDSCHGSEGRGDGARADSLEDDAGRTILPADLGLAWRYKGGSTSSDIFLRLTTGMDGTPMPSYRETLTEAERWALAYFVRSLQERNRDEAREGVVIRAVASSGPLPRTPTDTVWSRAPSLHVPLTGQATFPPRWQTPSVRDLWVEALYDSLSVALRLTWHDRFPDFGEDSSATVQAMGWEAGDQTYPVFGADGPRAGAPLPDALEVLYPTARVSGARLPHFVYGSVDRSVEVLRWSAAGGGSNRVSDRVVRLRASGGERPPVRRTGSDVSSAHGVWRDGRWSVVIEASRPERALGPGGYLPLTFHVRDGRNGEVGLRMSVASWYFLYFEETPELRDYLAAAGAVLLSGLLGLLLVDVARRKRSRGDLRVYGIEPR